MSSGRGGGGGLEPVPTPAAARERDLEPQPAVGDLLEAARRHPYPSLCEFLQSLLRLGSPRSATVRCEMGQRGAALTGDLEPQGRGRLSQSGALPPARIASTRRGGGPKGQGTTTVAARGRSWRRLGSARDWGGEEWRRAHGIGELVRSRFSPLVCGHAKEATERADLPASHCRVPHVDGPTCHGVFSKLNE
jgi:hypothetical protein